VDTTVYTPDINVVADEIPGPVPTELYPLGPVQEQLNIGVGAEAFKYIAFPTQRGLLEVADNKGKRFTTIIAL
jgi:hypothetical protein